MSKKKKPEVVTVDSEFLILEVNKDNPDEPVLEVLTGNGEGFQVDLGTVKPYIWRDLTVTPNRWNIKLTPLY